MSYLERFFAIIGDGTWGWSLIPFLVILGVFFTLASGFVQFRFFGRMFRVLTGKQPGLKVTSAPAKRYWSASGDA